MIIEQKSLDVSLDSEKDYDNNIYYFIIELLFLVGVQYIQKLKLMMGNKDN